jgi:multidrug efflux pump subunit AcrA (membrane-fusion protein)
MEADPVLVGSEQGGRVLELSVEAGAHVKQGDPIFVLESEEQEASVASARARLQEAEARLADAKSEVQRPDEIHVLEAALAQAQAMLQQANNNLARRPCSAKAGSRKPSSTTPSPSMTAIRPRWPRPRSASRQPSFRAGRT